MNHEVLHRRAREQGANPFVYWLIRALFQPFFHIYFRLSRIGREHIPAEGPVIIAANHLSYLDWAPDGVFLHACGLDRQVRAAGRASPQLSTLC